MQAFASGQARLFAVRTATGFQVERIDSGETLKCSPNDLAYFFSGCNDIESLEVRKTEEVRERAKRLASADRALTLFLILIDPFEPADSIAEIAPIVEQLLSDSRVVLSSEARLYSHELPGPIDFSKVSEASSGFPALNTLFHCFIERQPDIAHVRQSFDDIPDQLFREEGKWAFRETAIDRGSFRSLVLAASSQQGIDSALFELYSTLVDRENYREIISVWTNGFKRTPRIPQDWEAMKEPPTPEYFKGAVGAGGRQALENALLQQQAIVERIRSGDLETARRFAEELVNHQRLNSAPEHIAKSLARLSRDAGDLQAFELSLEWAERATAIKPDDAWAHGQLAYCLIHYGRYTEALGELDKAEAFGDAPFAATMRARIQRLQHQLPEALAAYESARDLYANTAEEYYNWAGVAEVLRDLGRLDDALSEYTQAAKQFPYEPVLACGRAATLAELGRFNESLEVYREVAKTYNSVVANNGIASVYKAMGQFEEAASAFSRIMSEQPFDVVCRSGLVEVLRETGRLDEAISLAAQTVRNFPESANALQSLGDAQRHAGLLEEAAATYSKGMDRFQFESYFPSALARVERERGRYDEALAAYERAKSRFPNDKRIEAGRAAMLRRLRRVDEALLIYDRMLGANEGLRWAANAKASILIYLGQYDDALALLEMDNPRTRHEWRTFLLRGLLDMHTGYLDDAAKRISWAIERVPFVKERRMFCASLATIELRRNAPRAALRSSAPCEGDVTSLIRFHALASAGHQGPARKLYAVLRDNILPKQYGEVREEIARTYGIAKGPLRHPPEWIFDQEGSVLLLEAA